MSEIEYDIRTHLKISFQCIECNEMLADTYDNGGYRIYECPLCHFRIRIYIKDNGDLS